MGLTAKQQPIKHRRFNEGVDGVNPYGERVRLSNHRQGAEKVTKTRQQFFVSAKSIFNKEVSIAKVSKVT